MSAAGTFASTRRRHGPPPPRPELVTRSRLVADLMASRSVPLVALTAGPGYGKTTLLAQWAARDPRPFAWIAITDAHNDAAVLLADVVAAVDEIDALDAETRAGITESDADLTSIRLPRLTRALATRATAFVLVLDNVQRLQASSAHAVVHAVCGAMACGSQLAVSSHAAVDLPVGGMRARRAALTIDAPGLAMECAEARELMHRAGVPLSAADTDKIVRRVEGWPAVLYLTALALQHHDDPTAGIDDFGGDDILVVEYLRDEVLAALPDDVVDLMTRVSVLDAMTGPLCDALLARHDSAEVLQALARRNPFVVALDRRNEWFRFHRLLRQKLQARLRHVDPGAERGLHARASAWFEDHHDVDAAVRHAHRSGDKDRFDRLVWVAAPGLVASGRSETVQRWLDLVAEPEVVNRAALVVVSAWCALSRGDTAGLEQWAGIASHVTPRRPMPDGTTPDGPLALLDATLGQRGIERMRRDAARAGELHDRASPFALIALLIEGMALRLTGEPDHARERLEQGVNVGRLLMPATASLCLAQLAALDTERGAWNDAAARTSEALQLLEAHALTERPAQVPVYATAALVAAHAGNTAEARVRAKHALWLLSMLTTVSPATAADARIILGRALLLVGDVAMARALVKECDAIVAAMPDAGALPERLHRLRVLTDAEAVPLSLGAAPMTPAEMRVLRYLPTHLSFAAIAEELFVSRNTVKTQAISIYRKLGVSSRAPAVAAARELGLLDD